MLHSFNAPEDVARLLEHLSVVDRTPGPVRSAKSSKRPIFVVGTDTDIGKTVVSAVLLRALARRTTPTYWKPVQTGEDSDTQTVRGLTRDCGAVLAEPLYSFPLPASPHEAAAAAESEIATGALEKELAAKLEGTQEGELLGELAGGLLVPYDDEHTQLDWLAARRPRIVLVARSGLGTLNHTLLSLQALTSKGLSAEALFLVGEPHPSNRETLARMTGVPHIFELPILDPLTAATLDQWIDSQTQPLP